MNIGLYFINLGCLSTKTAHISDVQRLIREKINKKGFLILYPNNLMCFYLLAFRMIFL